MVQRKLSWPQFDPRTKARVAAILDSGRVNYWTGEEGRRFEDEFARWLGVPHALAVSNGTAALQLALMALGVGAGDEVVCTPYSFIASSTCSLNAGATPVYADVGADHMLTAETVEKALTPRTKAIVVVHLFGQVADLGPILKLAKQRHLFVVEDCAQCLGGKYRGRKVGTLGDVGCFSFCQSKHITTGGEGGMVCTKSAKVARLVRSLRDHGWKVGSQPKAFERVGYNFRLTEIQSAIGRGELSRFDGWNLPMRKALANELIGRMFLSRWGQTLVRGWPVNTAEREASFWLVPFVLDERRLTCPVATFIEALQAEGVGAYRVIWPLPAKRPRAAKLMKNTLGFWVHPTSTLKDMKANVAAFEKAAAKFLRTSCAGQEIGEDA